ncbi:hypothetical protein F4859DRAFT_4958 [Xylaria cf. heliscus]|nr:hypothetical protein F4859DRAFT_4958 [Xylaria cf. heliscus]
MKLLPYITGAAAFITAATAQVPQIHVVGPFALRITGKTNTSIDGYAWGCPSGLYKRTLCYTAGSTPVKGSLYEFYYNYTYFADTYHGNYSLPGYISYIYTYLGDDEKIVKVTSFVQIYPNWASNVHVLLIPPGMDDGTPILLDFDTSFFYMTLYDDTYWNSSTWTRERKLNESNFHLCYNLIGGYRDYSLSWVSGLESVRPQNPTCEPVNLGVESLAPP